MGKQKGGNKGKSAPKGGKSDGFGMYGAAAVVVIIAVLYVGSGSETTESSTVQRELGVAKGGKLEITFVNPTSEPIGLYAKVKPAKKIADIAAGGTHTVKTSKSKKFFFSKEGNTELQVAVIDGKLSSYKFRPNCQNKMPQCESYKFSCKSNPGWMAVQCPQTCHYCHLQDSSVRCQRSNWGASDTPAVLAGDINKTFSTLEERFPDLGVKVLSTDPWVATFDNFISEEEVEAVLSTTGNFKRSTDQGKIDSETGEQEMVQSTDRTSTNTWCDTKCQNHPKVKQLLRKVQKVTRVPVNNYESLQVLNYKIGQFYATHHDANPSNLQMAAGHRVYTMFLYFSDVEEGGETDFPNLGIAVTPKKGKALLWPSLLDGNPDLIDDRTMHQAKPVLKGLKLAANVWVHQHDYLTSNLWGCTGSFDSE